MVLTLSHSKLGHSTAIFDEERSDERYVVSKAVRYTNLSQATVSSDGTLIEASLSGLRLRTETCLTPGDAIQIELVDRVLLGEVVHCAYTFPVYTSGIKLSHILSLEDIEGWLNFT